MVGRVHSRWITIGLMVVMILALTGCNSEPEFNVDALFSLEDFARDIDYAESLVTMLNRWHPIVGESVEMMGGSPNAIPFDEVLPVGWEIADSTALLFIGDTTGVNFDNPWYLRNYPDGARDYVRFNHQEPENSVVDPNQVEYWKISISEYIVGTRTATGDYIRTNYADNYENLNELEGDGFFIEVKPVFYSGTVQNQFAGMTNMWEADFDNVSANPNDIQGNFTISGDTRLDRELETVTLRVTADVLIRPNATGEATLYVDSEERVRIVFTNFDTSIHGYALRASDDFQEKINF